MVGVGGATAADIYAPAAGGGSDLQSRARPSAGPAAMSAACSAMSGARPTSRTGPSLNPDGWMGGIFGGYNFQTSGMFVVGLEGDFTLSGATDNGGGVRVENNWNSTLRARAGIAIDRFLIYGTGGLAVGSLEVKNGAERRRDSRRLDDRRRHRGGLYQQHHRPARVPLHRSRHPQLRHRAPDQRRLQVEPGHGGRRLQVLSSPVRSTVTEAPLRRGFAFFGAGSVHRRAG